jgi:hypothetical protein
MVIKRVLFANDSSEFSSISTVDRPLNASIKGIAGLAEALN